MIAEVALGPFVCLVSDEEVEPTAAPGFAAAWAQASSGAGFATMGVATYRRMSRPVATYVAEAVGRTLDTAGVAPEHVDHIVLITTDACLGRVGPDLIRDVVLATRMVRAIPVLLSFQQCCSSVSALRYAHDLFTDPTVGDVVRVSFELTPDDDRVRSFAILSDAVTSCLLRRGEGELVLLATAVGVDHDGLAGKDSFVSRQRVATQALAHVLQQGGTDHGGVTKVFATNLFVPLALFNASVAGIHKQKLHFTDALRAFGYCGGCDWMINLDDYRTTVGLRPGERYLAQASAPGFYACGLLEGA